MLPWLLEWPPRPAFVLTFLLLTAFSVGTLVAFAPLTDDLTADEVTVRASDVSVRLNDEVRIPDTNGTVRTCLGSGTPGDSLLVVADVTAEFPADGERYVLEATLADAPATTSERVDGAGRERWHVFWVANDDETLSVGETTEFRVRVRTRASGSVVAGANRTVTVENGTRSYDCGDS